MDALDLIINVLREHERALDRLIERIEHLYPRHERWILEEKPDILQTRMLTLSMITNILENKMFNNPSFSFKSKPHPYGDNILIDKVNNRKMVFGKSVSDPSQWNVRVLKGTEKRYDQHLQTHSFDSERKMLSWIIKYILRELDTLTNL